MPTALVSRFGRFCEITGLSLGIKRLALVHTNDVVGYSCCMLGLL